MPEVVRSCLRSFVRHRFVCQRRSLGRDRPSIVRSPGILFEITPTLGFQIKGRDTIALAFAQPLFFFVFSILTKLGDKINVSPKMTHFGLILPDFEVHFSRSPTTYVIIVKETKIKTRYRYQVCMYVIPSALAIMAETFFFRFVVFQKLLNEKKWK